MSGGHRSRGWADVAALVIAASLAACAAPDSAPPVPSALAAAHPPAGPERGASARLEAAPTLAPRDRGSVVLDRRADGTTITGRLRPFPPNADPARAIDLDPSIAALAPALAGSAVLDARFAGHAIVAIGVDRVLRAYDPGGGVREIDTDAHAPLSVAGTTVAYARGEIPELEIAAADSTAGVARIVTQGMAPAWSPALSADGRAMVLVSGLAGSPRLYRIEGDGPPVELPRTERTPSAPHAPRWIGELLVFEDEQGRTAIELETGRPAPVPPGDAR